MVNLPAEQTVLLKNSPDGTLRMPQVGLGTWRADVNKTRDAVIAAIKAGYRMVDTANDYGNEHEVGEARSGAL